MGACAKCEKCGYRATHGQPSKPPTRCRRHKLVGMKDLVCHRCEDCEREGLLRRASFAFPQQTPTKCSIHRLSGMRSLNSRYCTVEGCSRFAVWRFPDTVRTRCSTHRVVGMVRSPLSAPVLPQWSTQELLVLLNDTKGVLLFPEVM